ncbi:MAG: IMPACT family protein [Thermoanaerobaculia bacterium]
MDDSWNTVTADARASIKIERSEFTGIAFPIATEESFFERLHAIQKEFYDATHHCWAFRIRGEGEGRARNSDAGEPSGTAGRPILAAIEGAQLTDCGVVVVRYFGGIKLGTGGLARAYRDAAQAVLAAAPRETRYDYTTIDVTVPFAAISNAYRLIAPPGVILAGEEYGESNIFTYKVRRSLAEAFGKELTEKHFEYSLRD